MKNFVIPEQLLQAVVNYIGAGSVSKAATWTEVQQMLEQLQQLQPADQKPGQIKEVK